MSCTSTACIAVAVPGPKGNAGTNGTNGTNGSNAKATILQDFVMPLELHVTPSLIVDDSSWMVPGQWLYVEGAGIMVVSSKADTTHVVLLNPTDPANDAYLPPINTAPGSDIFSPARVAPSGPQGPPGA